MKRALFLIALLLPASAGAVEQRARYLMGTVCEIAVPAAHAAEIELAFDEAQRIESMLSTWIEESELSRLNRGELHEPSAELRTLLDAAQEWSRRTNGAFDPRIKSLIGVWKTREAGAVPSRDAIARALQARQWEEGAFGKGYALDRMLARLTAAEAMIDFGGQIVVRGELRVTIADPADRERPAVALTMRNGSISTSSGSEKTFEVAGRRFSHILDPRSGDALPPRGSVSVIAPDALSADILSTALYVMGEEEGLRWADANAVAAIFIDSHRNVRLSARARESAREVEVLDRNFSVKE
jgi:thiamine biosynthesis lipoprotein